MQQPKKVAKLTQERRAIQSSFSLRTSADASGKLQRTISGLAVVWAPARSSDLGGWVEEIAPTAFDKNLASNPDVVALWNHDMAKPMARTTSGTLRLSKTRKGLAYEFDAGEQTYSQDLLISLQRGDVHQSSFGFWCTEDSWREENGVIIRTVLEAQLFDVSPVTFPAYPDATSSVRAALRSCPLDLRNKLNATRSREDDDLDCDDPDSDDFDEDECEDRKRKMSAPSEDRCDCACAPCIAGDCLRCADTRCDRDACLSCPSQQRAAHLDLLLRRL